MSGESVRFSNRVQAAHALAERLSKKCGTTPLVIGIPRGGVPMARTVADDLVADLGVILVERLRSPGDGEFAIGAVSEGGYVSIGAYADALEISDEEIRTEVAARLETVKRRGRIYQPAHSLASVTGRVVIVVDDGVSTGSTMMAALRDLRARRPARLVVAVGAAAPTRLRRASQGADEVICIAAPDDFVAVSQFYSDFPLVTDLEAAALLHQDRPSAPLRGLAAEAS